MKNYVFIIVSLFSVLSISCGIKKLNIVPTINTNEGQIYFTSGDFGKFANLYSLDLFTFNVFRMENRNDKSEPISFQINGRDGGVESLYLVERFSDSKNTRVTHYSASARQVENNSFPMNVYDMVLHNNKIVSIGYDKGDLIKTDINLKEEIPLTVVNKLDHMSSEASISDKNIISHLVANGRVFAISGGSYLKIDRNKEDKKPKIYLLNDELNEVEKTWTIPNCFNAASHLKVIDSSKVLLSCNPNYSNKEGESPTLVLVDTSKIDLHNNELPINVSKKIYDEKFSSPENRNIYQLVLSGLSKNKNNVFVTEYSDYNIVNKSYWLFLESNNESFAQSAAGYVTYHGKSDSYIFSCHLVGNKCEKNKFVVSKFMDGSNPQVVDAKFDGNFIGFSKALN